MLDAREMAILHHSVGCGEGFTAESGLGRCVYLMGLLVLHQRGSRPARLPPAPRIAGNFLTDGACQDTIQASREPVEKRTSTGAPGGRSLPCEHRVRCEASDASLSQLPLGLLRPRHGWCIRPRAGVQHGGRNRGFSPTGSDCSLDKDKVKIFRQQSATQVASSLPIGGIGRARQKETRSGAQSRRQTADCELAR